jgi:TonB-linked SusC/RagA family outer membrane protein
MLHSQATGTIRGTVTGPLGEPLGAVQVSISAIAVGTITGPSGAYQITGVPAGTHSVSAQAIGYATETREIQMAAGGSVDLNFRLAQSAVALEGVMVTALGITRAERGLGYSVESVSAEQIASIPTDNISTALAGKAAGLQVRNLGEIGGSASVTLRGFSSISGSNQVLFIVDGVPVANNSKAECNTGCTGNLSQSNLGRSGVDYGNAIMDINPQDIESISVLKGANAAALYGARASNGVILITTKKGARSLGFQVEGSTGTTWSTPLRMPTYQNVYGGGQTPTDFRWVNGAGAGFNDATDESYGPPMDGTIRQQFFGEAPFLPSPYSPRSFFETGLNTTTNVAVSAAGDGRHIRFSATYLDSKGIIPMSGLDRSTFSLAGGMGVGDRLNLSGNASYAKTEGENRPVFRGYPHGIGVAFSYWQRQVDIEQLRRSYFHWRETGEHPRPGHPVNRAPNWNHNFFDSPFYSTHSRETTDTRDRLTGHVQGDYQVNSWLSMLARVGTDWQAHRMFERFPVSLADRTGAFINQKDYRQETNAEFLATGVFDLTGDLQLTARGGGNLRRNEVDESFVHAQNLNVPGVYNVANSAGPPLTRDFLAFQHVNSLYALGTLSFRDLLFLDVTGRNDWSSTLPPENQSYFYPSVSSSFIFTDAFQSLPEMLSYGQVRASWAKVGSDAQPYQLRSTFQQAPFWGSTPTFTHPSRLANQDLRPEETTSIEVGTDLRFAYDRVSLDLTYYQTSTKDQILPVDISFTTGYAQRMLNAGEVENRGVEATLGVDVLRNPGGFSWNVQGNWARNRSEVLSLTEGLNTIGLGNNGRGLWVEARVGERYGALVGQSYRRNDNGDILIGFDGRPLVGPAKIHGYFEPDWIAGLRNTLNYRGLDFSALFDFRQGGSIFCQSCAIQQRTGLTKETLVGREEFLLVHEGLKPDGTPNNVGLAPPVYWRQRYNFHENYIHDASFTKLREVSLGFAVPAPLVQRLPFSSARVAIVGRDLLLFTKVPHIDPELSSTSGNAQGMEMFLNPSPRSIGFTLSVR